MTIYSSGFAHTAAPGGHLTLCGVSARLPEPERAVELCGWCLLAAGAHKRSAGGRTTAVKVREGNWHGHGPAVLPREIGTTWQ